MSIPAPTFMEPTAAARILQSSLKNPSAPHTIADAAAVSGLALRDAERGLQWLTSEYRGHLRATSKGDLLYLFPHGFTKPWETREALGRAARWVGRALAGVARFVVRAWLTIVLFAYVGIFLAIVIGMMFARSNDSSSNRHGGLGGGLAYVLFRVLADALFWTFHPWSPLAISLDGPRAARASRSGRDAKDETPFYEKVNRFFFGPTEPPEEPLAKQRLILAEIRAKKGRIGLADVMRVTALPRDEADPLMARLMLDYDGDVEVSEEGGITYRFESIRKTATDEASPSPPPAWSTPRRVPPMTGNRAGTNVLIAALNGFNLLMSVYALDANLTLQRLSHLFDRAPDHVPMSLLPYSGTPIVLGVVPLVFSIALFAVPLARAVVRPLKARRAARENARLAVLREILTRVDAKTPVTDAALIAAWKTVTGAAPTSMEITKDVVALGGDVEMRDDGEVRYRFVDLETEAAALEAERDAAPAEEARVGKVVFASD